MRSKTTVNFMKDTCNKTFHMSSNKLNNDANE